MSYPYGGVPPMRQGRPQGRPMSLWAKILLIVLAVLIIGAGICTAILAGSLSGI